METTTAIILGASGSVGQALLAEILRRDAFSRVIIIARRLVACPPDAVDRVVQRLVPQMTPLELEQAVVDALKDAGSDAVGFSVLGVGAGTARLSLEEHRAVDVELNAAFARGLKISGRVRHLAFMSAVGADINARTTGSGAAGMPRYSRVKAEAEQAVLSQGPDVVSIFRPSVIIGSQHTPAVLGTLLSLISPLIPPRFRPIRASEIAQAMVTAALSGSRGGGIHGYAEMKALIA